MKVSTFDFNHARSLYFLLDEAHVARAAARLGITPAAASNALRRLREELGDPLLVKKGRGLVRTRVGNDLRSSARDVVAAAERLLDAARPFDPSTYRGEIRIAMSEHVADYLLPALDRLVREQAPGGVLVIASIPLVVSGWLEETGGVLVGPTGALAAADAADGLSAESFFDDRYVCVMRRGHPLQRRRWTAAEYAAQEHVLVTPRGRSARSEVDEQLAALALTRRIARVVPNFTLAMELVRRSDVITAIPSRNARCLTLEGLALRPPPLPLRPLTLHMIVHPAHAADDRVRFTQKLLRLALTEADAEPTRRRLASRPR